MNEREGVTKFRLDHTPGEPPFCEGFEELIRLRDRLHELGLIGVNHEGIGFGNVSIRRSPTNASLSRDEAAFIISGTGTGNIARLSHNGYCVVHSCAMNDNSVQSSGPVPASSESMTHYAVYAARPDVQCVIHVHSKRLFLDLLRRGTQSTPKEAAYGTPAMARAVYDLAQSMGQGLIVMTGHTDGVLAFGPDCGAAHDVLMNAVNRLPDGFGV